MPEITASDISLAARDIYISGSWFRRLMIYGRPYICPFEALIKAVPQGATVLDVGCGDGLFLNILGHYQRITSGLGFDSNSIAIASANLGKKNVQNDASITFCEWSVDHPWPEGCFDVVSMIDVLHHIPPDDKQGAILNAISRVKPGGVFLFKDIALYPRWRRFFNSLHDFVLARELVTYTPLDTVISWVESGGMQKSTTQTINRIWYGHEMVVFT